jgi:hypothetical protein
MLENNAEHHKFKKPYCPTCPTVVSSPTPRADCKLIYYVQIHTDDFKQFYLKGRMIKFYYVGHHSFNLNCIKTCRILKTYPQCNGNTKIISNNFIFLICKVFHKGRYALSIPSITTKNPQSTEQSSTVPSNIQLTGNFLHS